MSVPTAAPTIFVPFVFQPLPSSAYESPSSNIRDRARAELRAAFNAKLAELTNDPNARMRWTVDGYAKYVVRQYRHKLHWPSDIPFANLSDLRGGVRLLDRLRDMWDSGVLRYESATADDIVKASKDPRSVHPNPQRIGEEAARRQGVIVAPLVMEPITLGSLGVHPTSTDAGALLPVLGKRARNQRIDVKRPRRRPVTNPNNLPLRRRKRGVTSEKYVLEVESEIEDFDDEEERAAKRSRFSCVSDPIEEFV